jgi:hypothetical protein
LAFSTSSPLPSPQVFFYSSFAPFFLISV